MPKYRHSGVPILGKIAGGLRVDHWYIFVPKTNRLTYLDLFQNVPRGTFCCLFTDPGEQECSPYTVRPAS